ncbi:MAG: hypothetical protein CL608_31240 [Anaerolineaceae bacterium]|nr:hypothetical protein [Anaerolineaceae bacterium]
MLSLEFEEPQYSTCECCGNKTTKLVRYVLQNDNPFALYMATYAEGHERKLVELIVGLGSWNEDSSPSERTAFTLQIWENRDEWAVSLTNADDSTWGHVTFLGQVLDREEALQHPWINDVYKITDHILSEDKAIIEYFTARSTLGVE